MRWKPLAFSCNLQLLKREVSPDIIIPIGKLWHTPNLALGGSSINSFGFISGPREFFFAKKKYFRNFTVKNTDWIYYRTASSMMSSEANLEQPSDNSH
jgi:hypothetical protein